MVWFFALYFAGVLLALLFIWSALPTWICLLVPFLVLAAWIAMLVDSFRPGKLTIPLFVVFALVLVVAAILPSPGHFIGRPFQIPTGAMQPTLDGIIGRPSREPSPSIFRKIGDFILRGRNYIDVVSREDDQVLEAVPKKAFPFFTFTRLVCRHQVFLIYIPPETLRHDFSVFPGSTYKRGEIVARGAVDAGDRIFVDRLRYHFTAPRRGDLIVFSTKGIVGIPEETFYVKRLAGLPGDTLRIDPPHLYINGRLAAGPGFSRVMSAKNGYHGYASGRDYLARPDQEFRVPEGGYFVLGDNSYNSYDSRHWGCVPASNIYGRISRIYYPFSRAGVPR
jgi:signal peptidase I